MKVLLTMVFILICYFLSPAQDNSKYIPGNRYAIIIGISSYENSANNLRYAKKDAIDFQEALIKYGRFEKDDIKLLVDKDASRENIRKCIEGWLWGKAKKNDLVFIFFSGHGSQIPDTDGDEDDGLDECLIPFDFDNDDYSSVITDDIFAYWIRNLQSEKVIIVFDNCFSGGAAKQKGVSLSGVKGNIGKDDFSKDIAREVPRNGTALLAASKADQVSFESSEFENGIFTHFLINSISSTSDNDFNKIINPSELFYSTRQQTLEYSKSNFKREQEPLYINSINEDVELFYLPSEKITSIENKNIEVIKYKIAQEKDYKKKIELYKNIYNTNPNSEEYNSELARLYDWNNEYLKAIEHYKYILSLENHKYSYSPPISARIGELYNKLGQKETAIHYYSLAINEQGNNPSLYNKMANLYLSTHDTLSAIQYYNKSVEIQQFQKDPYLSLFYIHLNRDNYDVIKNVINKSYRINAHDFETTYWYVMSEKFISKNPTIDSLFLTIRESIGIKKKWDEINSDKSRTHFIHNGKELTKQEQQLYAIKEAIDEYPYYDEFYKSYIRFIKDNNINEDVSVYKKKYLLYSKLNPDILFIDKYLK